MKGHGGQGRVGDRNQSEFAEQLALAFAQLFVEVEAGRRSRLLVERLMAPHLAARLAPHWVRGGRLRRVLAASGQFVHAGRFEAVVILWDGRRAGALALRLEQCGSVWRVTDAARPEDGNLPHPAVWLPSRESCAFETFGEGQDEDLSERTVPGLAAVVGL